MYSVGRDGLLQHSRFVYIIQVKSSWGERNRDRRRQCAAGGRGGGERGTHVLHIAVVRQFDEEGEHLMCFMVY